jgi:hypothetical protein
MKYQFVLYFTITATILGTSCSEKINIYKKHFSSGYNINVNKRASNTQHSLTKKGVYQHEFEIINQTTSSIKPNAFKEINEVQTFIHSKKIINLTLKKTSSNGIKEVLKSEEKVLPLKHNINQVIIQKGEINQKKPYNGCVINLNSSFWYTIQGLLSLIFTVLVIILVISIFKSLAISLVLISPIILFTGMVTLIALALFVILS